MATRAIWGERPYPSPAERATRPEHGQKPEPDRRDPPERNAAPQPALLEGLVEIDAHILPREKHSDSRQSLRPAPRVLYRASALPLGGRVPTGGRGVEFGAAS